MQKFSSKSSLVANRVQPKSLDTLAIAIMTTKFPGELWVTLSPRRAVECLVKYCFGFIILNYGDSVCTVSIFSLAL